MEENNTDKSIKLLTPSQAASILKVSGRTLHRMINKGQIPAFKLGGRWRILESRFEEWVQEEASSTRMPQSRKDEYADLSWVTLG